MADTDVESDETLRIVLSNGRINPAIPGGTVDWATSNETDGIILNDDQVTATLTAPLLQAEGVGNYIFTVTLNQAITDSNAVATLDYATSDGTATVANLDYSGIDGTGIDLTTGGTVFTFNVPITDDGNVELAVENFSFAITGSTANVTVVDSPLTGRIIDDDKVTATLSSPYSQNEDAGNYVFTVTLSQAIADPNAVATLDYATNDGTATLADTDYSDNDDTGINLATNDTVFTFAVPITPDSNVERPEETFTFAITDSTANVIVVDSPATGRILDDDQVTATLSAPSSQAESVANYTFTVTLDQAITDTNAVATLDYATSDGTATVANLDYSTTDGTGIDLATGATVLELDYKCDLPTIKQAVLGKSTILGVLDPSEVLALGTPELVTQKVREELKILAPGGGLILGPGCSLSPNTPPENIHAMIEATHHYGRYTPEGKLLR